MRKYTLFFALSCSVIFALEGCGDTPAQKPSKEIPCENGDTSCEIVHKAECGDGMLDKEEVCDESAPDAIGATCADYNAKISWQAGGKPGCSQCRLTQGTCSPVQEPKCGNGIREDQEICDGTDGVPAQCSELPQKGISWAGGKPACSDDCSQIITGTCFGCGDGIIQNGEVCDGTAGVPELCSELPQKNISWAGGKPACSNDCSQIITGTCFGCGDGIIQDGEQCDGTEGVPESCSAVDPEIEYTSESYVACSNTCQIDTSSCLPKKDRLVFMNWNILKGGKECHDETCTPGCPIDGCTNVVNHDVPGKEPLQARAERVYEILSNYSEKPDIIALVEATGEWQTNQAFELLGYEWSETALEPTSHGPYWTKVLYKKDRFEVIENEHIIFVFNDQEPQGHGGEPMDPQDRLATCAVLKEIPTDQIFIACATHWYSGMVGKLVMNPDGTKPNELQHVFGYTVSGELNRVQSARDSIAGLNNLRAKYPDAHFLYAGDFNAINLKKVFETSILEMIDGPVTEQTCALFALMLKLALRHTIDVAAELEDIGVTELDLKDLPSVIKTINTVLKGTSYPVLPDDFIGGQQEFSVHSGLVDARAYALQNIPGTVDNWSFTSKALNEYEALVAAVPGVSLVVDYAFFSPELTLTSYNSIAKGDGTFSRDDYFFVSDHFPIITTYEY